MEINGVAHIQITASDFAKSVAFYKQLLPFLGLKPVSDGPNSYYGVGGRTGFLVSRPSPENVGAKFDQRRVGLHHICWRVRSREDVEEAHTFVQKIGAKIMHGPQEDGFAPGYYSILFEDPDGIRLEINHVPGRGVFDTSDQRVHGADWQKPTTWKPA